VAASIVTTLMTVMRTLTTMTRRTMLRARWLRTDAR
jgi:hypothetical protein